MLPEDWVGHPLRKDYVEQEEYDGISTQRAPLVEKLLAIGANMNETAQEQGGFYTEDMTISVGPQHPSTHGVLRFVVKTDGEVISEAIPDVGYSASLHRKNRRESHLPRLCALHRPRRLLGRHVCQSGVLHGSGKTGGYGSYAPRGILPGDRLRT